MAEKKAIPRVRNRKLMASLVRDEPYRMWSIMMPHSMGRNTIPAEDPSIVRLATISHFLYLRVYLYNLLKVVPIFLALGLSLFSLGLCWVSVALVLDSDLASVSSSSS